MLTSLLCEVRIWPVVWRRRLAYWLVGEKDNLAFLVMLGLPILAMAGIIYFAYVDGTRIQPAHMQAVQREATRAHRRANDLQCLAENVYFEARGEPLQGQYAVAEGTLDRTRTQHFPHTICEVVHETRWDPNRRRFVADFSWAALGTLSPQDGPAWKPAISTASAANVDRCAP